MSTDKPDRNYDTRDLNKVFAIGSIVLFITVLAMVADDYMRQWKDVQRRFHSEEARRTKREIGEAERAMKSAEMTKVRSDLDKAEQDLTKNQESYENAKNELDRISADFYGRDLDYRFAKATYDSKKYDTEVEIDHLRKANKHEKIRTLQEELDRAKSKMDETKRAYDAAEEKQKQAKAELARLAGKAEELRERISKMAVARDRLQKKLGSVSPGFVNWLINAPMLDFMAPTLTIQQVVLPKLRHDINFMEIPRVDRCMTCHTVIDKPGYEKGVQPFRTHPNLQLYVDPASRHPMESFGCTACHAGRDRGTSFTSASHTPDSPEQRKQWQEKHGWQEMHFWETPMRSRSHFYAGCLQCHMNQAAIAGAGPTYIENKSVKPTGAGVFQTTPGIDNLNRGLRMVEVSGCTGCHLIKGLEHLRKLGPDLTHIISKTDPKWAFRWIRSPRTFRSAARMPTFFGQTNQTEGPIGDRPAGADLNDAEIDAIVTFLWDKSEPIKYENLPGTSNPGRGKDLVHSIGCLGCHTDDPNEKFPGRTHPRAFGPNLGGLGSKTSQTWLFNWLKNPKHYWKDTYMPSLRLTDQEALDISAYLSSSRNSEFDKIQVPTIKKETLDWLAREYLSARMSVAAAEARIRSMTERDKKLYLGEKMINKYGCFGCHAIKGFENAQSIGTELTEEGSKPVVRLDFGLEEDAVEHSLPAWVAAKLQNPRRFDRGKIKTWDEKLKMPNFYFNEDEITSLVTLIQGLSESRMDVDMRRNLAAEETFIEKGRRIVRGHNCIACHITNKEGGAIRGTIQDPGFFPPILDGEGEKVIPLWLFNFIKGPTTIRPWLNVRMPTFSLDDHETATLSKMFAYADKAEYPFESEYFKLEPPSPAFAAAGSRLFTDFKCLQCHIAGSGKPEREAADLAPNLSLARARLRPNWIEKWLKDPQALQAGTRMPGYFPDMKSPDKTTLGGDSVQQIRALKYHVLSLAGRGTPAVTGN